MPFNEKSEAARRRLLKPWTFRAYLLMKLPLAACAGLRLRRLDEGGCTVSIPGGWRTQNPFRSTYFAAQMMAAEMSTGAPAMMLVEGAPASVALILRDVRAVFTKKVVGTSLYTFSDVASLREAVERAAAQPEETRYTAHVAGRLEDGT
ncbi:MAG TPA: DUF4442 domain-containing protein, partial [Vicinamibacteria bacterium]|nr:DUF4442 domain-containing protein [Vicinamibacteria bacterium]